MQEVFTHEGVGGGDIVRKKGSFWADFQRGGGVNITFGDQEDFSPPPPHLPRMPNFPMDASIFGGEYPLTPRKRAKGLVLLGF